MPFALPAAPPPCSLAAAKAAIVSTRVKVPYLSGGPGRVTSDQADGVICFDFTRDGRKDMAVTIASGGTAGDIAWVVFAETPTGYRVALVQGGYKLSLYRVGGDLVSSQPIYRKNDANCCPTGGFDHDRWHWDGSRFAVVHKWHNRTYRPTPEP